MLSLRRCGSQLAHRAGHQRRQQSALRSPWRGRHLKSWRISCPTSSRTGRRSKGDSVDTFPKRGQVRNWLVGGGTTGRSWALSQTISHATPTPSLLREYRRTFLRGLQPKRLLECRVSAAGSATVTSMRVRMKQQGGW